MILHNPESVKVTNDYLYNIIHTATLNDHRDIIPIAIEVSKTVTCVFNTVSSQRRYEIINIPCDLRIPIRVIVGVCPLIVAVLKNGGILKDSLAQPL